MKQKLTEQINTTLEFGVTNSITSDVIDLSSGFSLCSYAKWTKQGVGVLAGSVVLEKSIDGEDWYTVSTDVIGNATGNAQQEKIDIPYQYARVVATLTGGKADIVVKTFTKGM